MSDSPFNLEQLLSTTAHLLACEGCARELALLVNAQESIECSDIEPWDGISIRNYTLFLRIPVWVYTRVRGVVVECEKKILEQITPLMISYKEDKINRVSISPQQLDDKYWREKGSAWGDGKGIINQGLINSINMPSRTCDRLLFRSQAAINLYNALNSLSICFAPLPVFQVGGYRLRVEPDFVLMKDGIVLIVKLEGDTVYKDSNVESYAMNVMRSVAGAHYKIIKAVDCKTQESACACAYSLWEYLQELKPRR